MATTAGDRMRAISKALSIGLCATAAAVGLLTVPAAATTTALSASATSNSAAASVIAADSPSGFAYGTDSWPISITDSVPYKEPVLGGSYGGYMGMAGNWARWAGCKTGNFLAWSAANAAQANANYLEYHTGVGT